MEPGGIVLIALIAVLAIAGIAHNRKPRTQDEDEP